MLWLASEVLAWQPSGVDWQRDMLVWNAEIRWGFENISTGQWTLYW